MLILNTKVKNNKKLNQDINNNLYKKNNFINKGYLKHYPSSIKEWYNSAYYYYKNESTKILYINNEQIYKMFYNYFNYNKLELNEKLLKYTKRVTTLNKKFYMSKTYISNPEIKQSNNKVNITLYIYNKQLLYILKDFLIYKNILKKFNIYNSNNIISLDRFTNLTTNTARSIYIYILSKYQFFKLNLYLYKHKFNIKNLLYLKSLLNKMYNKNIEINIINLKYLYLDSKILAMSIARKLKYKRRYVLSIIRLALNLSKKPYKNEYYNKKININNIDKTLMKKSFNIFSENIPLHINIINKPLLFKSRILFYYLNNKIITGIKLQGAGRLTRRITASRSITKFDQIGNLKNDKSSLSGLSTVVLKGYVRSNLQYSNINSNKRIGSYGIKSWVSSN